MGDDDDDKIIDEYAADEDERKNDIDDDHNGDEDEGERLGKKKEKADPEMPEYDDSLKQLIEAADKARAEFENIDKTVRELENEKSDLEAYIKFDFGPQEEFSSLKGECYE